MPKPITAAVLLSAIGWMLLNGCSPRGSNNDLLQPGAISIRAYVQSIKYFPLEFTLGGKRVYRTDLTITPQAGNTVDLKLIPANSVDPPTLVFSPSQPGTTEARFLVVYQGNANELVVTATGEAWPQCPGLSNACSNTYFDPNAGQCVTNVDEEGTGCEEDDCTNPGTCQKGLCVHQPLTLPAPWCWSKAPQAVLSPTWIYTVPNRELYMPQVIDADGNTFHFDSADHSLVSLSRNGQVRWRKTDVTAPYGAASEDFLWARIDGSRIYFIVQSDEHQHVEARRLSDGAQLWATSFYHSAWLFPFGSTVWLGGERHLDQYERTIVDAETAAPLASPTLVEKETNTTYGLSFLIRGGGNSLFTANRPNATDSSFRLAAVDPATGEFQWTQEIAKPSGSDGYYPVAADDRLLLLGNGSAFDLSTRTLLTTAILPQSTGAGSVGKPMLEPTGQCYVTQSARIGQCSVATLVRLDARQGTVDWRCSIGDAGHLLMPPSPTRSGNIVVLTSWKDEAAGNDVWRPLVRVFGPNGEEKYSAVLSYMPIRRTYNDSTVLDGNRIIIRLPSSEYQGESPIAAFDLPLSLTQ